MENGSKCMLSAPILTGNSLSGTKPHPRRNKKLGHSSSTEHISKEKLHHQGKEESEELKAPNEKLKRRLILKLNQCTQIMHQIYIRNA